MVFRFSGRYAVLSIVLLTVEVLIAVFVHDRVVRPFVGDVLVVVLVFTACRTFLAVGYYRLALGVLLFAVAVEIGQYLGLVSLLGLEDSGLARVVIGMTFDPFDLLAYATGIALVCLIGALRRRGSRRERLSSSPWPPPSSSSRVHGHGQREI